MGLEVGSVEINASTLKQSVCAAAAALMQMLASGAALRRRWSAKEREGLTFGVSGGVKRTKKGGKTDGATLSRSEQTA